MADDGVVRFIRRVADPTGHARATDRELLDRYLNGRDEGAFEALVRRHDRLVRSAVARVLTDPGEADDAVQATFLVLVRRAAAVDRRADLGPWLYGVAHRVAIRLRARARRQPAPLGPFEQTIPGARTDPSWREACDLLHAELDQLPDRYRLPLLLCYLEGQTRDEAAAVLGLSSGAVKGRVRRGCDLLRRRLARRGVSFSIGLLAATAPDPGRAAAASAPAAAVRGTPSPAVAELVREVARTMTPTKLKLIPLGLIVAAGLVAGVTAGRGELVHVPPVRPVRTARPAPAPPPRPAEFLVQHPPNGMVVLGPDGKENEHHKDMINATLSPDGRWLAGIVYDNNPPAFSDKGTIVIRSRDQPVEPIRVPQVFGKTGDGCLLVWAPDNRRLLIREEGVGGSGRRELVCRVYDRTARTTIPVKLRDGYYPTDWSRDGKRFLAAVSLPGAEMRIAWINSDGAGEPEFLIPENEIGYWGRVSPDGRRVLFQGGPKPANGERTPVRLYVLDLVTKERTAVDEPGETYGYCWSPDGTRVAYTWQKTLDKPEEVAEREAVLFTCDITGRNRKRITSRKTEVSENSSGRGSVVYFFWVLDWR